MRIWKNPTGGKIRPQGQLGAGHFGASRDGGKRKHPGVDYLGDGGQDVVFVTNMTLTKIGYPYGDDLSFRYIRGKTTDGHIVTQMYVKPGPGISVGMKAKANEKAGTLQTLQGRYNGMVPDHCHVTILGLLNPEKFIPV